MKNCPILQNNKKLIGRFMPVVYQKQKEKRNVRIFFHPIYTKKVIGQIEKYSISNKLIGSAK
jgi:hypothetical protein